MSLSLAGARGESPSLFPLVMPWDDATPSFTNLSGRLTAPAGSRGFIKAQDSHLVDAVGRVRFVGVNLCFGACFPTHEEADKIADRMAKLGINCVRFHHMDTLHAPDGLLRADRRSFDAAMLDRLDYFIAALKKRGIYLNLNLHVGRLYPEMPVWKGMPQYFKGVDQFYPPMVAMQKEYARALLTHVNRYTELAYKDEPAIAFIEINNENSLIDQWWKSAIDTLPDPYGQSLLKQWEQWQARNKSQQSEADASSSGDLGQELLHAGESGVVWNLETHGAAEATMEAAQEGWSAKIAKKGDEAWHVQVNSSPMELKKGEPYTFTFEAASQDERQLTIALTQAVPPWKVLWSAQVSVGPQKSHHSLVMSPGSSEAKGRIGFINVGQETGEVSITSASLREGAPAVEKSGGLFKKSTFAARSSSDQRAWIRFLWEVESDYWRDMRAFLKGELKVQSLLIGSQVGFSPVAIQAEFDVIDAHGYWQHPVFPHDEWNLNEWSVNNIPMAGVADGGALAPMAALRATGKPFICTEYSHPAPNAFGSESLPLLGAYAALQDWDGIFAFAYSHRRNDWAAQRLTGFFDIDQDPSKLATLPATVNLFIRGDVTPAREKRVAAVSATEVQEEVRFAGPNVGTEQFGFARNEFLSHAVGLELLATKSEVERASSAAPLRMENAEETVRKIAANQGQLTWETPRDGTPGVVVINTPKTKGVIGKGTSRAFALGDITITPGPSAHDASVILVTEMAPRTGFIWKEPRRLLVSATGACENTDMEWKNDAHTSVGKNWGKAPTLVEGIHATITFHGKGAALKVWALNERGERKGEIAIYGEKLILSPEHSTLWYEVEWAH